MQSSKYLIQTATLVNRSPVLTRPPTSFEAALYQYNANIGRALFNPFPYDFYFKSGSLLKRHFNQEERIRESEAFNWGKKTSSKTSKRMASTASQLSKTPIKTKVEPATSPSALSGDDVELMSRITEADKINDIKSLNRNGHRNLYLLIKKGSSQWRLPGAQGGLRDDELLHEAAKRELHGECGANMDVWIVGRNPIGFMNVPLPRDIESRQHSESKVFFFKAHILAGQIDPTIADLKDFAWLTKAEVKQAVTPEYWNSIHNILSDY